MLVSENVSLLNSCEGQTQMYKVLLIGDIGVGKSSILMRYTQNAFSETFISTIGMDLGVKNIKHSDNTSVQLSIWDTAGQERFDSITSSYYRGANGIVLCVDLTNRKSFDNVAKWFDRISRYGNSSVSVIIVGTKCDMIVDRCVDKTMIEQLIDKYDTPYIETSSKTGENIDQMFVRLSKLMLHNSLLTQKTSTSFRRQVKDSRPSCRC